MASSRTFLKRGVTCCDKTHCGCCVLGRHFGMKVCHGSPLAFFIAGTPFGEEADGQTSEHAQDPDSVTVTDTAIVFVGGGVEPLMEAAFDAPILADRLKPLDRVQLFRRTAADQAHRFWLMFTDVAIELCNLFDVREAGTFRGCRLCANLPTFPSAAIDLVGPGQRGCHGLREKKPPVWRRRSGCVKFAGGLFGFPSP